MSQFWDDIGNITERGVNNYYANQEHRKALAQQQEDRRRQQALQDLAFAKDEALGYRQGGNLSAAANALQQAFEARNRFDGGSRVGPKYIGTPVTTGTGHEQAHPAGKMQGPMPEATVTTLDPTRPDWKNPANSKVVDAYLGYQAPRPEPVKIGRTIGHYDRTSGKFVSDFTEPDPMEGYRNETLQLRRDALEASKTNAAQASADRAASRSLAASNHADARRRRTTTATIDVGGKPVTVLVDAETGDVIKEIGAKAATPKAPAQPKAWSQEDENRAMQGAKLKYPDPKMGNVKPETLKQREAYVAESKRQHAAAARKAAGPDEFDQWAASKLKARKGGKP